MLLAKKKYYYGNYDYLNEEVEKNKKKPTKRKKNKKNLFLKISAMVWVFAISAALILVLLRYTEITETEYKINSLNKEIEQLEDQLQDARMDLDSLTRSDVIERVATEDLNMQYPQYNQMVFLNLDNTSNLDLKVFEENPSLDDEYIEEEKRSRGIFSYLKISIKKIYSLLD